jgi:hypothetical protein
MPPRAAQRLSPAAIMIAMRQRSCAELDRGMIFSLRPGRGRCRHSKSEKLLQHLTAEKTCAPKIVGGNRTQRTAVGELRRYGSARRASGVPPIASGIYALQNESTGRSRAVHTGSEKRLNPQDGLLGGFELLVHRRLRRLTRLPEGRQRTRHDAGHGDEVC